MCGRYVQAKTVPELVETFAADDRTADAAPAATEPSWNVAPSREVPVVVRRGDEQAQRELRVMRWGLVPSWAKDPGIGNRLINARAETLADKPSFRVALARRRCLVPADGWYEWMPLEPGPGGKARKQAFWFSAADGSELAFAGLFEHWRPKNDPDAPWLSSFTVVTTTSTDEHGHVHDRSPVPVAPGDWDRWMDRGLTEPGELEGLLQPAAPGLIVARPVSAAVGNVRNDGPELIAELPISDG